MYACSSMFLSINSGKGCHIDGLYVCMYVCMYVVSCSCLLLHSKCAISNDLLIFSCVCVCDFAWLLVLLFISESDRDFRIHICMYVCYDILDLV